MGGGGGRGADTRCPGCRDILENPNTTVPEIFAVLRQWTPQTQQRLELLVDEVSVCVWEMVKCRVPRM